MARGERTRSRRKTIGITLAAAAGVVVLVAATGVVIVKTKVDRYTDPGAAAIEAAGYVQRTARVNDVDLSYVEGPDNGPPLVLLHAQHMDWYSYNLVLPALAESFHVYDIDYPGHGATTVPDDYTWTADQIGSDLSDFMAAEIGEPAFVTGNSSGGLLTTWLAANRPDQVRAVLLEDPPLFSAEADRIDGTIADRSFTTSYDAVQDGDDDFLLYWIESNSAFFTKNVGPGTPLLLTEAVKSYRGANPGAPVEISLLSDDTVRQLVRGLDQYDPRFGAAFHDGTWNAGFDHADALSRIECPTLLLHAEYSYTDQGILNGALDQDDADRAMSLLQDGTYQQIDSTHVVHLAHPEEFVSTLEGFFLGDQG